MCCYAVTGLGHWPSGQLELLVPVSGARTEALLANV
jgi:hypothetical protein